jgi:hypothetical protein
VFDHFRFPFWSGNRRSLSVSDNRAESEGQRKPISPVFSDRLSLSVSAFSLLWKHIAFRFPPHLSGETKAVRDRKPKARPILHQKTGVRRLSHLDTVAWCTPSLLLGWDCWLAWCQQPDAEAATRDCWTRRSQFGCQAIPSRSMLVRFFV